MGPAPRCGRNRPKPLDYLIISLRLFSGWALTRLRAGLALTTIISPGLNGFGLVASFVARLGDPFQLQKPWNCQDSGAFFTQLLLNQLG